MSDKYKKVLRVKHLNVPLLYILSLVFVAAFMVGNQFLATSFGSKIQIVINLALVFGILWWALVDAKKQNFQLSLVYKLLLIFLAPIGLLVYAFKSRKMSFAWLLVGKYFLFFILCNVVAFIGMLIGVQFAT